MTFHLLYTLAFQLYYMFTHLWSSPAWHLRPKQLSAPAPSQREGNAIEAHAVASDRYSVTQSQS